MILDSDGTVLLCLHEWAVEKHPSLMSPGDGTPGNGLLLFFRVDDYDAALRRARSLVSRLAEKPHVNPNTRTKEFSLRDPDGYYVHDQRAFGGRGKKGSRQRHANASKNGAQKGRASMNGSIQPLILSACAASCWQCCGWT
jgi:hypothetical protein